MRKNVSTKKYSRKNIPGQKVPQEKVHLRRSSPSVNTVGPYISPEKSSEQIIHLVKNPPIPNIFHSVFVVFCVIFDFLLCDIENIAIF